jgi:hypothetical protein
VTTTSQVPAVIDYLVAQAQASANLGASATAKVRVIDGPPPTGNEPDEKRILYIGWDQVNGSPGGEDAAQSWPVLDHARTRDEDGTITCTADAWLGGSMKEARDACAAIVAGVELLLRGDRMNPGPGDATMGGLAMWSSVDDFRWYPRQDQQGAGMACVFTVSFRARLTTTGA